MKNRPKILLITIMAVIFLITACSCTSTTTSSTNTQDGSTLLQDRCTVCHNLSRVERAKHTPEEWQATVNRMIGKGAKLTSDEKTLLIEYLSTTYGN